ncbi:MAG: hypothetical protein MI922_27090 [Bacteroidales bacterium]|nr:hypothetical protein [Bacteroidales bacterium]
MTKIKFALFFLIIAMACSKDEPRVNPPVDNFEDYDFEKPVVSGNTYYIDPVNGSPLGDGSEKRPWRTLQEVLDSNLVAYYQNSESYNPGSELKLVNEDAPVKGGDRIVLLSGYHGYISRNTFIFKEWITIEGKVGHTPVLSQIRFEGAFRNIYLNNITVIKDSYEGKGNYWEAEALNRNNGSCVILSTGSFWGEGSDVKLNNLTIKTTENTGNWLANDWVERSATGISTRSTKRIEINNCNIENVRHGVTIEYHSDDSRVLNTTINNYCADGSRIISDNILFAYNTITNCYKVDDNHDDAIQSYSRGEDNSAGTGTLHNVVIRGNLIVGVTNSDNPLAGNPQGIGCFDGMFNNWIVENNVVITDHYHGISFYGMTNSKVVNNTVIDQNYENKTCPWIKLTDHKSGTKSSNCIVANNIVSSSVSVEGDNITELNNYIIGKGNFEQITDLFVSPEKYQMFLKDNDLTRENIIDKGDSYLDLVSSKIDKEKNVRDSQPDLGAYELIK